VDRRGDEQLLAEHLAGAPDAFGQLVTRYVNEVYGFLCRFVGNEAVAEDLTQDTFVQVHLSAASFDASRAFKPWLYTIAANKARDYLRTRGRRQEFSLDASADEDGPFPSQALAADEPPLEERLESEEQREIVRKLIARMPEHLRLILILGYFQQLPYAEIADVLHIPVGTVKSRLHAAVNYFARLWRGAQQRQAQGRGSK